MSVFSKVGRARHTYSNHNMSYRVLQDADFGKLYPVYIQSCVPGDVLRISNEIVLRFMPMLAPILHEINIFVHYFFTPKRILWDGWEQYITGGEDGMDNSVKPRWNFDNYPNDRRLQLWEYMAHHINTPANPGAPLDCFTQRCYNMIWNEWYRDTHLQEEVDFEKNNQLLYRSWRKDYFTSARLDTQLGEQPAIPVVGDLVVPGEPPPLFVPLTQYGWHEYPIGTGATPLQNAIQRHNGQPAVQREILGFNLTRSYNYNQTDYPNNVSIRDYLANMVKVQGFGVDVNQLREIVQIQRWKERNMRAGARYVDFIKSRFKAYPRDDRLQRPEYIGGTRAPVIISEVLQTSEYGTDGQGNPAPTGRMSGHGMTVDRRFACKYRCHEYGIVMGLMSIMPKAAYAQGVEREFCYETKYDEYFPEFQHLGEQPVFNYELLANGVNPNGIFGYQGRYNEMRYRRDKVVGLMRDDLSHWHLSRYFANIPVLNGNFIACNDVDVGRVFAVPSEPPMIVNFGNLVRMTRPMVAVPNPGLVDHI